MFLTFRRKIVTTILVLIFVAQATNFVYASDFKDVPNEHWASVYIYKLREIGIMEGIGDNEFGLGKSLTKAEFITFLCKLMGWDVATPNADTAWYEPYLEAALTNGAIDNSFGNPTEAITREKMTVTLIKALGYDGLAKQLEYLGSPFTDVTSNTGHITIAKDLNLIAGMGDGLFMPTATVTREQAAVIMTKCYEMLTNQITFSNAFYAINSAEQMNYVNQFDSISFGWCRLELDGDMLSINATAAQNNEYRLPTGYNIPYEMAEGGKRMLMVAVSEANAVRIINDTQLRQQAAEMMSNIVITDSNGNEVIFDGIVVDFETLKGSETAQNFNEFLTTLRDGLNRNNKLMFVAVHPKRGASHEYFDGYDYKTIGYLADKVILMAHDYNAKSLLDWEMEMGITMTPLAPIADVYYALRAITDQDTGVQDIDKIVLQISFSTAQWKLHDGKVINSRPFTPLHHAVANRIRSGADMKYSDKDESPYITFFNSDDGTDNIVWYEDERSVAAKIELATRFGITGVSIWRLGTMPNYGSDIYMDVADYLFQIK